MTVTNRTIPLPFRRPIEGTRQSNALPLAFLRRLGEADDSAVVVKRRQKPVGVWGFGASGIADTALDLSAFYGNRKTAGRYCGVHVELVDISGANAANVGTMWPLRSDREMWFGLFHGIVSELHAHVETAYPLRRDQRIRHGWFAQYVSDVTATAQTAQLLRRCTATHSSGSRGYSGIYRVGHTPALRFKSCRKFNSGPARDIPGEFYPIPLEPEPPVVPKRPCWRPEPDKIPLAFKRKRLRHHPAMLPLDFACETVFKTPNLQGYIVKNTVSASFIPRGATEPRPLQLLSANPRTDNGGYCWQVSVTLYPDDFAALEMDERPAGEEAEITVTINGEDFKFIAEDYSDNREFGKRTYTVTGRSTTARLASDYARVKNGEVGEALYARQIAEQQLSYLPFTITFWRVENWLVPAGSYTIAAKTPMDVLMDIAKAAGGFVASHPSRPQLSINPRWPVAAWEIDKTTPDVTVPAGVMISVSGQKRVEKRMSSVYAWATHAKGQAADVFRTGSDRLPRANALTHDLFTDTAVLRAAGTAALSDTGRHKIETVKLPLSETYAIPRGEVGKLWQFNEPSGYWKGVITGVSIDVSCDSNGAVTVYQTLTVDRYLDV